MIDKLSAVGNSTNSGITIGKSVLNLVANIASGNIGGIIGEKIIMKKFSIDYSFLIVYVSLLYRQSRIPW